MGLKGVFLWGTESLVVVSVAVVEGSGVVRPQEGSSITVGVGVAVGVARVGEGSSNGGTGHSHGWGVSNNSWGSMGHNWGRSVSNDGWGSVGNDSWGSVDGRGALGHNSVEAVDIISVVVDGADGTVGLNKGVLSLHDISITDLSLGLDISGEAVMDSIVEGVLWVGLQRKRQIRQVNCWHHRS